MPRNSLTIPLDQYKDIKNKCLAYAQQFSHLSYFNPSAYPYPYGTFKHVLFMGCYKKIKFEGLNYLDQLSAISKDFGDYIGCSLSYDLKNQLEDLKSENPDSIGAPLVCAYIPQHIVKFNKNTIELETFNNPEELLTSIVSQQPTDFGLNKPVFKSLISKSQYIETIQKLRMHIEDGDMYEINFCMELLCQQANLDPMAIYQAMSDIAPAPFSVYHKQDDIYVLSASPERFLKKEKSKLISQPIKGTSKRGSTTKEDKELKVALRSSEKERAENMMIVDLVRNDLSKSCKVGSVKVDEMFKVYTFPHWHQMISTVTGELKDELTGIEALTNAFPMGSMTGAPKFKVMQLIEKYEQSRRGLYSGSIGYIEPNGDFDFNVIIRSLIYNKATNTCSYQVGGAITYDSDPELEYQECLTKAKILSSLFTVELEN